MADHPNQPGNPSANDPAGDRPDDFDPIQGVPVEEEAGDEAAAPPRRAASAEFVVDTRVGSEALLREAMDPANQSLAEALRLSFRVLQVVILVLVVLFVFSGFQTVDEGQSGVLLRWGKILTVRRPRARSSRDSSSASGRIPRASSCCSSDRIARSTSATRSGPRCAGRHSIEAAISAATVNERLRPGPRRLGPARARRRHRAHPARGRRTTSTIPSRFVDCVENTPRREQSRRRHARRARASSGRPCTSRRRGRSRNSSTSPTAARTSFARLAQEVLDGVDSGHSRASTSRRRSIRRPALAIKKAYGDLQEAAVVSDERRRSAAGRGATGSSTSPATTTR